MTKGQNVPKCGKRCQRAWVLFSQSVTAGWAAGFWEKPGWGSCACHMHSDLVFSLQHSSNWARKTSQVLGRANAGRAEPLQEFLGSPSPLGQRRCFLHPVSVMHCNTVDVAAALVTIWFSRREILSQAQVTGKYKTVKSVLQRWLTSWVAKLSVTRRWRRPCCIKKAHRSGELIFVPSLLNRRTSSLVPTLPNFVFFKYSKLECFS